MADTLQVEIVKPEALSAGDIETWRAMVAANPDLASPYFRPEFAQIAGAISPHAAVALLSRGGQTVGFFPYQMRGGTVQPLGAPMNDYHGVIAHPGQGPDLETLARLMKTPRLRVGAWVGPVGPSANTNERDTLMTAMPDAGYDAWYAERRQTWGKYFKDKERARRSLEADVGPVTTVRSLRDPALLDTLIDMKRDQYRRTGRHDIFDCGWTRELLHALLQARGQDDFGASMAAMYGGDRLLAVEYSLHAAGRYHFWFPVYEPALARCSPGILLCMDTMRMASEVGYRTFDFGFGGEGYKKYFCNLTQTVREAVVARPGIGVGLSNAAVSLLNTVGAATAGGAARGDVLRTSVRRRWGAIEACETTKINRLRGAVGAAQVALAKGKVLSSGKDMAASRLQDPAVSG